MSFSRRHYRFVSPPADTPQQVAERFRVRRANEQAHAETRVRFPVLTEQNIDEALTFQARRIDELLKEVV